MIHTFVDVDLTCKRFQVSKIMHCFSIRVLRIKHIVCNTNGISLVACYFFTGLIKIYRTITYRHSDFTNHIKICQYCRIKPHCKWLISAQPQTIV